MYKIKYGSVLVVNDDMLLHADLAILLCNTPASTSQEQKRVSLLISFSSRQHKKSQACCSFTVSRLYYNMPRV